VTLEVTFSPWARITDLRHLCYR